MREPIANADCLLQERDIECRGTILVGKVIRLARRFIGVVGKEVDVRALIDRNDEAVAVGFEPGGEIGREPPQLLFRKRDRRVIFADVELEAIF